MIDAVKVDIERRLQILSFYDVEEAFTLINVNMGHFSV